MFLDGTYTRYAVPLHEKATMQSFTTKTGKEVTPCGLPVTPGVTSEASSTARPRTTVVNDRPHLFLFATRSLEPREQLL